MTWHIICQDVESDTYTVTPSETEFVLEVPVDNSGHPNVISNNILGSLEHYGLTPTEQALDFLYMALSVYTADIRVLRSTAHDNWTRDFILHLPVSSPDKWDRLKPTLEHMISFLTGDRWRINIRKSERESVSTQHNETRTKRVCLFSGGLDSFIGASDLLAERKSAWLISHYTAGPLSEVQKRVFRLLETEYPQMSTHMRFYVQPPKRATKVTELTTRSRSILFMGLAVATAGSLGKDTELVVPENGLISLNVPLTFARTSSFSTRTTHPYFLHLVQQILDGLELGIKIVTPYRFLTKGEMLKDAKNQSLIRQGAPMTMSCSHPGVGRHDIGGNAFQHCGYCVPCIIRRSSMASVGLDDPSTYAVDILTSPPSSESAKGRDLRAFEMALYRNSRDSDLDSVSKVLNAGPLPGTSDDFKAFVGVYQRGMDEVRGLLSGVMH